jgi:hypothetical protein
MIVTLNVTKIVTISAKCTKKLYKRTKKPMSTIKEHYELLRHDNVEMYGAMNGKLSSKMLPTGDCLTYFKRSVVEKQAKGGHVDMAVIPGYIQKQMVEFLGFTWKDIWSNTVPALSVTEPAN